MAEACRANVPGARPAPAAAPAPASPAPVELVPYSADWPRWFAAERQRLEAVFPAAAFRIEHIGSTAVPGLDAKPIVDILLGAPTLEAIEARIPAVVALGYEYVARYEASLPQRRYFTYPAHGPRRVHLHAVELEGDFWASHLRFRDALRARPALAAEYLRLKTALAARHRDDRDAYTRGKAAFIAAVVHVVRHA